MHWPQTVPPSVHLPQAVFADTRLRQLKMRLLWAIGALQCRPYRQRWVPGRTAARGRLPAAPARLPRRSPAGGDPAAPGPALSRHNGSQNHAADLMTASKQCTQHPRAAIAASSLAPAPGARWRRGRRRRRPPRRTAAGRTAAGGTPGPPPPWRPASRRPRCLQLRAISQHSHFRQQLHPLPVQFGMRSCPLSMFQLVVISRSFRKDGAFMCPGIRVFTETVS